METTNRISYSDQIEVQPLNDNGKPFGTKLHGYGYKSIKEAIHYTKALWIYKRTIGKLGSFIITNKTKNWSAEYSREGKKLNHPSKLIN